MSYLKKIQHDHKDAEWARREYRQLNEIKKVVYEQNENISKEIETVKKTKTKTKYKNTVTELKKSLEGVNSKLD